MILVRSFVASALFVALASACSGAPQDTEPTGRVASPIIDGTPSDASQNAVVRLVILDPADTKSDSVCTGTLLAPDIVVTARHCVSRAEAAVPCLEMNGQITGSAVFEDFQAENILVVGGTMPAADQTDAKGAKIFHDSSTTLCGHDLALVVLDRKLGSPVAPIRIDSAATLNERFTAVGWGMTATGFPTVRQQHGDVGVEHLGPLVLDLDGAHRVVLGPNELLAGESNCSGDSGGPALDATTGAIIGVATRSGVGAPDMASPCKNSKSVYAMPSGFKDVIDAAFSATGEQVWIEGNPEPPQPAATPAARSKSGCAVSAAGERITFETSAFAALVIIACVGRRRSRSRSA